MKYQSEVQLINLDVNKMNSNILETIYNFATLYKLFKPINKQSHTSKPWIDQECRESKNVFRNKIVPQTNCNF